MSFSVLELQILATLAYTDQFSYPLSAAEIEARLVAPEVLQTLKSKKVTPDSSHSLTAVLKTLLKKGRVVKQDGWFGLAGSLNHFKTRAERERFAQPKWREAEQLAHWLSYIPWVRGVAVTGSLAMSNVTLDDDVDVLIVTQPRRLWLTRLVVTAMAWAKGKRRSWHGEEKNSWCFNLWLDENHIAMPSVQQNVYGAYEVIQARWLFSTERLQERFWAQNEWVKQYVPHWQPSYRAHQDTVLVMVSWSIMDLLESLAYVLQKQYMKAHMTREKVDRGVAFFHPRNTKKIVETQWAKRFNQVVKD